MEFIEVCKKIDEICNCYEHCSNCLFQKDRAICNLFEISEEDVLKIEQKIKNFQTNEDKFKEVFKEVFGVEIVLHEHIIRKDLDGIVVSYKLEDWLKQEYKENTKESD